MHCAAHTIGQNLQEFDTWADLHDIMEAATLDSAKPMAAVITNRPRIEFLLQVQRPGLYHLNPVTAAGDKSMLEVIPIRWGFQKGDPQGWMRFLHPVFLKLQSGGIISHWHSLGKIDSMNLLRRVRAAAGAGSHYELKVENEDEGTQIKIAHLFGVIPLWVVIGGAALLALISERRFKSKVPSSGIAHCPWNDTLNYRV